MTTTSSRKEQLFVEDVDESDEWESDNDAVEEQELLRSFFLCLECEEPNGNDEEQELLRSILLCVECDEPSGNGKEEENEDLLSIFGNDGMWYDIDDEDFDGEDFDCDDIDGDAAEQDALRSLL